MIDAARQPSGAKGQRTMSKLPSFDKECFFISPIGVPDSDTRHSADGVRDYIVKPAVAELGLQVVRADDIAEPGHITLQVIEHVLSAKAAIADLSGANANVFYELAVRHTAQLPVVLIAHENDHNKLPFDIAQMRTIFYDDRDLKSASDCKAAIGDQLATAIDGGSVDSPVAASANLVRLQGGNPSEQVLARLVGTVDGFGDQLTSLRETVANLVEHSARRRYPSGLFEDFGMGSLADPDAAVRKRGETIGPGEPGLPDKQHLRRVAERALRQAREVMKDDRASDA